MATAAKREPSAGPALPWLRPGVVIGALIPGSALAIDAIGGRLGADPVALALNRLGLLALILLLGSLAATPLRLITGARWPMRLRKPLGLLAFGYASLHLIVYAWIDQGLDLDAIWRDVSERRFISAGFAAYLLLLPLAATSTAGMQRRLGGRRWQRLHRLVYLVAILAAVHFLWRVKRDLSQPGLYAAVLAALLAIRVRALLRRRRERAAER